MQKLTSAITEASEKQRLAALHRLKLLDTPREARFDRITATAKRLMGFPMAVLSLVDENRQWFKSCDGAESDGTPRDIAFCSHAIAQEDELFVIPNAIEDVRFADNPLVTGPLHVRFYAGRVLRTSTGEKIGTLCVLDTKPFAGSADDLWQLSELGAWAEAEIINQELSEQFATRRDLQATQLALLDAAKWSSIGELTAGICHEIATPLTALSMSVADIQHCVSGDRVTEPETLAENVQTIEAMTQTIQDIVRGLRAITRNDEHDPFTEAKTSDIIGHAVSLLREKFRRCKTTLKLGEGAQRDDLVFSCLPAQVQQVIVNLMANAVDAVEALPERWVSVDVESKGDSLVFRVVDSGAGIPADVAARLMEPFFTTKDAGKGTGLGLSISRRIASHHGGLLELDTTGPNTTFVLTLPKTNSKQVDVNRAA